METSIQAYIKAQTGIRQLSLFGYTTKGLPGLEIHGLKKSGRLIKEKIIYLTRKRQLKAPLLKYCLCLDSKDLANDIPVKEMISLEIPFLLMFWHLAGFIPISKLDDCRASGTFSIKGHFVFNSTEQNDLYHDIGVGECVEASGLLSEIPDISFETKSKEYLKAL